MFDDTYYKLCARLNCKKVHMTIEQIKQYDFSICDFHHGNIEVLKYLESIDISVHAYYQSIMFERPSHRITLDALLNIYYKFEVVVQYILKCKNKYTLPTLSGENIYLQIPHDEMSAIINHANKLRTG